MSLIKPDDKGTKLASQALLDPNDSFKKKMTILFLGISLLMPSLFLYLKYQTQSDARKIEAAAPKDKKQIRTGDFLPDVVLPLPVTAASLIRSHDGKLVYVIGGNKGKGGVVIVDVSDVKKPKIAGYYKHDSSPVYFNRMDATLSRDGKTLFVVDWNYGLFSLDVSDPKKVKEIGKIDTIGCAKLGLSQDGTKVYLAGKKGLFIVNVKDKKRPILLSDNKSLIGGPVDPLNLYDDRRIVTYDDKRNVIEINENIVYFLKANDGIEIFDVSNPSSPKIVGRYGTLGQALEISLSSNRSRAYIASGRSGVEILDISDPLHPKPMGGYVDRASTMRINASKNGTKLFMANGRAGLQVLDISYPYDPKPLQTYKSGFDKSSASDSVLSIDEKTIFITYELVGLAIASYE